MIVVNNHELVGTVLLKKGPYAIGLKDMNKSYLYVTAKYISRGKETSQVVKAVCFSWGDSPSKISQVFPGDEVKFNFDISGRINEEKKDNLGNPSCFNEIVIASPVTILSSAQRKLYTHDTTAMAEVPVPKFKYDENTVVDDKEEPSDLPF